jgi:hypothetical protein
MTYKGHRKFLGYYLTEVEAALAYDQASLEMRGRDGHVNFESSRDKFAIGAMRGSKRRPSRKPQHEDDLVQVLDSDDTSKLVLSPSQPVPVPSPKTVPLEQNFFVEPIFDLLDFDIKLDYFNMGAESFTTSSSSSNPSTTIHIHDPLPRVA